MILPLDCSDVVALDEHLVRHLEENDADRFMVSQPLDALCASFDPTTWPGNTTGGDWQRVWALRDGLDIRAHIVLTGNPLAPHRCSLGMGVERGWRGKGIGRQLMNVATGWAAAQPSLSWVDGMALAHNSPVIALDKSVGFYEVGRIPDVARFDGRSVAQLQLVLDLSKVR